MVIVHSYVILPSNYCHLVFQGGYGSLIDTVSHSLKSATNQPLSIAILNKQSVHIGYYGDKWVYKMGVKPTTNMDTTGGVVYSWDISMKM